MHWGLLGVVSVRQVYSSTGSNSMAAYTAYASHSRFTKAAPWTASSLADVADGRGCASQHGSSIPILLHGRNSHVLDGLGFQVQITMAPGCCEGLVPVSYVSAGIGWAPHWYAADRNA